VNVHDEEFLDEIALLALGVLPGPEAETVAVHVRSCESCRALYAQLRPAADLIGYSAEESVGDDEIGAARRKRRIMASVRDSLQTSPDVVAMRRRSYLPWMAAAAAVVIAGGLGIQNVNLRNDYDREARIAQQASAQRTAQQTAAQRIARQAAAQSVAQQAVAQRIAHQGAAQQAAAQRIADRGAAQQAAAQRIAHHAAAQQAAAQRIAQQAAAQRIAQQAAAQRIAQQAAAQRIAQQSAQGTSLDRNVLGLLGPTAKRYAVPHGVVISHDGRLFVALSDLAQPPSGKVYQTWTLANGKKAMTPGRTFVPNGSGVALVELGVAADDVAAVAVSVEPAGGSRAPTSKPTFIRKLG